MWSGVPYKTVSYRATSVLGILKIPMTKFSIQIWVCDFLTQIYIQ